MFNIIEAFSILQNLYLTQEMTKAHKSIQVSGPLRNVALTKDSLSTGLAF